MKTLFIVPDVEHNGDIDHFKEVITKAGGTVIETRWSGNEEDDAYIVFECKDTKHAELIIEKCEKS